MIDSMPGIPGEDSNRFYDWIKPMLMDRESHELFSMPAQCMLKDLPGSGERDDDITCTRGADQVLCAGYFPVGLSLDRIFRELPDVPLRDEVWPKFLRENAVRVFKLES